MVKRHWSHSIEPRSGKAIEFPILMTRTIEMFYIKNSNNGLVVFKKLKMSHTTRRLIATRNPRDLRDQKINTCVCIMILNNLFPSGPKAKFIKMKISFSTIFFASLVHRKLNYKLVAVQSWSTYNFILLIFLSEHGRGDVSYGVLEYKVK